jgi:hypothetical protein
MFNEIFSFFGLFKIVCFVLLIKYLVKLINTYAKPQLQREVVRKEERFKNLKKDNKYFEEAHKASLQETVQKTDRAKTLLSKIKVWHSVIGKKFEGHEQERSGSQNRVKEYLQEQARLLSVDHTKKEIIPEAVQEVLQELQKKFSTSAEREAFLKSIFIKMGKE